MTNRTLTVVLITLMFVATALAAHAYPNREITYVRVGETADGQPVYMALMQMKYMDAALAAYIFGGQAVTSQQYGTTPYRTGSGRGVDPGVRGHTQPRGYGGDTYGRPSGSSYPNTRYQR